MFFIEIKNPARWVYIPAKTSLRPKGVLPPFRSAPKRVKKYQNSEFWIWMAYPPPFIFFKNFLFSKIFCALFKVRVSVFRKRTNFGINDSILAEIANMSKSPFSKMVKKSNQWGFQEENSLKFFFLKFAEKCFVLCYLNFVMIFSTFFMQNLHNFQRNINFWEKS